MKQLIFMCVYLSFLQDFEINFNILYFSLSLFVCFYQSIFPSANTFYFIFTSIHFLYCLNLYMINFIPMLIYTYISGWFFSGWFYPWIIRITEHLKINLLFSSFFPPNFFANIALVLTKLTWLFWFWFLLTFIFQMDIYKFHKLWIKKSNSNWHFPQEIYCLIFNLQQCLCFLYVNGTC